jgi:hypothetical protein
MQARDMPDKREDLKDLDLAREIAVWLMFRVTPTPVSHMFWLDIDAFQPIELHWAAKSTAWLRVRFMIRS